MNRIETRLVGLALVAAVFSYAPVTGAQQPSCGDATLRKQAVGVARAINTSQIRSIQMKTGYQPLSALGVTIPAGLSVQLLNGPAGYLFSVKETPEACPVTLFSDQEGVIYFTQPIQ